MKGMKQYLIATAAKTNPPNKKFHRLGLLSSLLISTWLDGYRAD
jgi:hypothetical protein